MSCLLAFTGAGSELPLGRVGDDGTSEGRRRRRPELETDGASTGVGTERGETGKVMKLPGPLRCPL